ncbi:hypothetical protein [Halomarina ordinaria]|uniref:Cell surface glycoprotein n=1 Tax=Halomarina ordinaria TaxID=3033939 RepID=A0ABD5UCU2_9EURY|nr:hypothetical protein [Halomarina sp. PSRA2]
METSLTRRYYLALAGSTALLPLAGCAESTEGNESGGDDGETNQSSGVSEDGTLGTGNGNNDTGDDTGDDTENDSDLDGSGSSAGESYSFEGSGTDTSDEFEVSGGVVTVDFTHDGERNFIAEALAVEGDELDDRILVNEIGAVEGGQANRLGSGPYQLNVDADGEWTIELAQPGTDGAEDAPVDLSGSGNQYEGPYAFSGVTEVSGTHEGERNFIVEAYAVEGDTLDDRILINEIGSTEASTSERLDGIYYLNVQADGGWTLSAE